MIPSLFGLFRPLFIRCRPNESLAMSCFVFQWNGSTTFSHLQLRERTDYGMCCWFTPQFNFTEILRQSELDGLTEPDWGHWFMKIDKASS